MRYICKLCGQTVGAIIVPRRQHLWKQHKIDPWQNNNVETYFEKKPYMAKCVMRNCEDKIHVTINLPDGFYCYMCEPHYKRYVEVQEEYKKSNDVTEWQDFVNNMALDPEHVREYSRSRK